MKLTLVVPVYGVEKYIHKFFDTLSNNLLTNVEVLLIDDGSHDNCGNICDAFALKYPINVKVVHKVNGGVSSARNKGLELAKGEYIIFPDPDDLLSDDYTLTILNAIDQYNNPDMIFFDFYIKKESSYDYEYNTVPYFSEGIIDKRDFMKECIKDTFIKSMVWCKVIKKSFFCNKCFDVEIRFAEDYQLLTDLILQMEKIVYIKKPIYYYFLRGNSLTSKADFYDCLKKFDLTLDRYNKWSNECEVSVYQLLYIAHSILIKIYNTNLHISTYRYERIICLNIRCILLSEEFTYNFKKQCLLIFFGVAKYYYKIKTR